MIELDGTKIGWYGERVKAWRRGEKIVPITVDMALTTACNLNCEYCYGRLQENTRHVITKAHMTQFLDDCAQMGVKGVSLVSDGESSISPAFEHTINYGASLGLAMAVGTNGLLIGKKLAESIIPNLSYMRFNISAGESNRYMEIMGAHREDFTRVIHNIRGCVAYKRLGKHKCTIGMQMVFMPKYEDQVLPLAHLALELGVDYLVIKHCSDDEQGSLGVDYGGYEKTYATLKRAEALSTRRTLIKVKWSKITECGAGGAVRSYKRCYGVPFILQISGTGLVAPCGMLFNSRYKRYHMGNITQTRFKHIVESKVYWEVIKYLASGKFDAQRECGSLCLQHSVNKFLDALVEGDVELQKPEGKPPMHKEFI